jgi:DNA-3-methyladenine glycosylase
MSVCLDQSFYSRPTDLVAKELLGNTLVRLIESKENGIERLSGIIVETEAYGSDDDPASHAYRGLTPRNAVMFGDVGRAYVYFTYGNYFCVNVSARECEGKAGAVLIRALQPVDGIEVMKSFRKTDNEFSLTSGPGKLTQAMNITKLLNNVDVTDPKSLLSIEWGFPAPHIVITQRIGITRAVDRKWRYVAGYRKDSCLLISKYASRRR